jgi:TolA-binding protein
MDTGLDEKVRLLANAKALALRARELRQEISDAEARTKELSRELAQIVNSDLVEAMSSAELNSLQLAADGNNPALNLELGTSVHASIPVGWPEERRAAAFNALPDGLVTTTVTVYFSKDQAEKARRLYSELMERYPRIRLDREVHFATLTAWVRHQFEDGEELPDLETIGATIMPRVKITEVKDERRGP